MSKIDMSPDFNSLESLFSEVARHDNLLNNSIDLSNRKVIPLSVAMKRARNIENLKGRKVRFIQDYCADWVSREFKKGMTGKIHVVLDNDRVSLNFDGYITDYVPVSELELIR